MKFFIGYLIAMGILLLFMAGRLPDGSHGATVSLFAGSAAIGAAAILILGRTEK